MRPAEAVAVVAAVAAVYLARVPRPPRRREGGTHVRHACLARTSL